MHHNFKVLFSPQKITNFNFFSPLHQSPFLSDHSPRYLSPAILCNREIFSNFLLIRLPNVAPGIDPFRLALPFYFLLFFVQKVSILWQLFVSCTLWNNFITLKRVSLRKTNFNHKTYPIKTLKISLPSERNLSPFSF